MEVEYLDSIAIEKLNILWNWINNFILKPNKDIGRDGPVCPFCPISLQKKLMKIYPLRGQRSYSIIEPILLSFRDLFLKNATKLGEEAIYQTFILFFPDIEETNYKTLIDDIQCKIKPNFVIKGLMIGEFHPLQESQGIHNENFRPLQSPIPLLVIRHMTKLDIQFLNTPQYSLDLRIKFMSAYLETFKSIEVEKLLEKAKNELNTKEKLLNIDNNLSLSNSSLRNSQYSYLPSTNFNGTNEWTILYGTQTGTASSFALILSKVLISIAKKQNYTIRVLSMDEYKYKNEFIFETHLFIITSTFGSGDPPNMGQNFKKFLETLHTSENEFISKYCIFGLGSKLYPNYCQWAKDLDNMLYNFGGNRILPLYCANELENQQASFQHWIKELVFTLQGNTTSFESYDSCNSNDIWTTVDHGLACPKLKRISNRIDTRSILEKVIQALRYSYGCDVTGVQECLIGAANLLQTSFNAPNLQQLDSTIITNSGDSIRSILQSAARVEATKTRTFDLIKVFDSFDRDGDGVISYNEFENSLKQLGVTIDHNQLTETLKILDSNSDRQISVEEFINFLTKESDNNSNSLAGRIISTRIKPISRQYPYFATLIENKELFSTKSARSCRLLRFDISDFGSGTIHYQPGDHLGIFPENDPQQVHTAIRLLRIANADIKFEMKLLDPSLSIAITSPFSGNITYWQALSSYVDLHKPPSAIMCKVFAKYCEDINERKQLELLGSNEKEYEKWINEESPTIISFLCLFSSLNLKNHLGTFFEHVPPMQPRWYSICSSLKYYPNEVHICVAHFAYRANNGDIRKGVCSDWLRKHTPSSIVDRTIALPIFSATSSFHIPDNSSIPIIMIATGTGLAPFRSFWQERLCNKDKNKGEFMLYYGCRSMSEHIFKDEIDKLKESNIFSHLTITYSRPNDKNIPQRRITKALEDDSELLYNLCINNQAYIYICGDITVAESIKSCLNNKWSNIDKNQNILNTMKLEKRLLEDIFGSYKPKTYSRIDELNKQNVKGL